MSQDKIVKKSVHLKKLRKLKNVDLV